MSLQQANPALSPQQPLELLEPLPTLLSPVIDWGSSVGSKPSDGLVSFDIFADDFDENKIREILAQDAVAPSQFEGWYIDDTTQTKINDFFRTYGIEQSSPLPPINWFQTPDQLLPDPLAPADSLTNPPTEQAKPLEQDAEVDSQFDWSNFDPPPLNLPEHQPHPLLDNGSALLNHGRPIPAHNPQISQYIDYVRHDPTKTLDEIKQLLENIRPDMDIPPENREGTPEALVYPLMEHQKLGLAWMKAMEEGSNKGGILADDMGLGKTIQAIALIVARPSPDPRCKTNLIIAPLSLLKQWEREIQKKLKQESKYQLSVYIHHGSGKKHKTFQELTRYDVVLTTFGTLAAEYRKRVAEMERCKDKPEEMELQENNFIFTGKHSKWYRILIDEAQCIKNKDTLSARGCAQLAATYRFCLSGTPMQNRCEEYDSFYHPSVLRFYC